MSLSIADGAEQQQAYRLIVCPRLLTERDRLDVLRPEGGSVADLLRSIGWQSTLQARVYIDGDLVSDARWESVQPRAGQSVIVRAVPMGGSGGGKDALRIVAMIGVIVAAIAAPYAAPFLGATAFGVGTFGGAVLSAGVSIIGSLAVSALIPPARPKLNDLSGLLGGSNTLAITGTANQLIPYGVVPRVYGRHRIFPPYAARPYTEVVGSDQYLRAVFCLGRGPLALSDFKIGETPLGAFTDVEIEVRQGYASDADFSLYPAGIHEETLSLPITVAGGSVIRASAANAAELAIDLTFYTGLWEYHTETIFASRTVEIDVEYRLQGETTWIPAGGQAAIAATATVAFAGANNDLLVTAVTAGADGNNILLSFVDEGDQFTERLTIFPTVQSLTPTGYHFQVTLRKVGGVYSTASQIVAFLATAEADAFYQETLLDHVRVADWLIVALAPGNDGSGEVAPHEPQQLTGGQNFLAAFVVTDNRNTLFRASHRWAVSTPGIYEVKVTRLTPDNASATRFDAFSWTALRTIRSHLQVMPKGMCGVAIRIKATNQLNGQLDAFNCFAESILPDWNGQQWVARVTNNPASIFRDVHQGTATLRPKADSRLDLITLVAWHGRCAAADRTFNAVVDFRSTVEEIARDVLAAGMATPGLRDGKISLVEDLPQAIPVELVTPRNSWGFKATKTFSDLPHAVKVRFVNANTLQQDERLVIADGYGVTGEDGIRRDTWGQPTTLPEATQIESVEAGLGVTDPEQVFRMFRYHQAVLTLRPELYTVNMDFQHLTFQRGDLIAAQHDVPLMGLISGRIKSLTTDGVNRVTSITLDDAIVMEAGKRYGVRMRLADGSQVQREVETVVGTQSTFTLLEPV